MQLKDIKDAQLTRCDEAATHKFFIATTVGVEAANQGGGGKVSILLCCTACGKPLIHTFFVPGNVEEAGHLVKEEHVVEKTQTEVKQ